MLAVREQRTGGLFLSTGYRPQALSPGDDTVRASEHLRRIGRITITGANWLSGTWAGDRYPQLLADAGG